MGLYHVLLWGENLHVSFYLHLWDSRTKCHATGAMKTLHLRYFNKKQPNNDLLIYISAKR